jgi:hypothetical protein
MTPHIWYFPSTYGDIRLERVDAKRTKLIYFDLTSAERKAMTELRKASTSRRRRWATQEAWDGIHERDFDTGDPKERVIELAGSMTAVGDFLRKQLRPERKTVTAIRIGQGKIEEMVDQAYEIGADDPEPKPDATVAADASDADDGPANDDQAEEQKEAAGAEKPTKAATVKKPVRGCPAPSFASIKLRATRVLRAFLTPQQVDDFNRYQRFVTRGADTGHQYMLTSRNAPDELRNFGARCVFDLNENRSYCVHDWDVPAEEEILALHILLSLPGYERWARAMPDDSPEGQNSGDLDALLA